MTVEEYITFLLEKIISYYHPEEVYLFGSQARGDATIDSDIDILIVHDSKEPKRQRALQFRKMLRGQTMYPVDILVYTPDEFENEHNIVGTIAYTASREGIILYRSNSTT